MSPSPTSLERRQSPLGCLNLELSPVKDYAVSLDPEPDWTLDDLKAELNCIEAKYNTELLPENKRIPQSGAIFSCRELCTVSDFGRNRKTFVMRAFDGNSDDSDGDHDAEDEDGEDLKCSNHSLQLETDLTRHNDMETANDELDLESAAIQLMSGTGVVEGSLFELERERALKVQEEIRERMLSFEEVLKAERTRSSTALLLVDKEREEKQEMARRVDKQYLRKIAEARDSHLSAVQQDHQQRSQIEERRIRKEAAVEEARKREKEAREVKERQEKARADAEAKLKAAAEAERKAAAEAERQAAAEAQRIATVEAERKAAAEAQKKAAAEAERKAKEQGAKSLQSQKNVSTDVKSKIAESAAKLEAERIGKLNALQEQNQHQISDPNLSKELKTRERQIGVRFRQITGTQEQVSAKANELIQLVTDRRFPSSILLMGFAEKAVSQCETQTLDLNSVAFALAHVIVLVTSQVPDAMELILAEFHKSCIFTVPKYIPYVKNAFDSENAYYKAVGYREDNGKLESTDNYVARMKAYIALYAAIIQTDIPGIKNFHGIKDGLGLPDF